MIWFNVYNYKKWFNEHLCNIGIKYDYILPTPKNQSRIDKLNHYNFKDLETINYIGWLF